MGVHHNDIDEWSNCGEIFDDVLATMGYKLIVVHKTNAQTIDGGHECPRCIWDTYIAKMFDG